VVMIEIAKLYFFIMCLIREQRCSYVESDALHNNFYCLHNSSYGSMKGNKKAPL
jgi:hypothetical protein